MERQNRHELDFQGFASGKPAYLPGDKLRPDRHADDRLILLARFECD